MRRTLFLAMMGLTALLALMAATQSGAKQGEQKAAKTSPQLVAWTQNQKVQPIPATGTTLAPVAQDEMQKTPAAQAFLGTIMKQGDTYVLQTTDNVTYQLDDQERAKGYEGKQVQVTGSLDKSSNTIKVSDIKQTA
jgi:uncharacterized protein DUF5818